MAEIQRAWRVLAGKPSSDTAGLLRLFIAAGLPLAVVTVWTGLPLVRPGDVAWAYALLWVTRQRDEARAARERAGL